MSSVKLTTQQKNEKSQVASYNQIVLQIPLPVVQTIKDLTNLTSREFVKKYGSYLKSTKGKRLSKDSKIGLVSRSHSGMKIMQGFSHQQRQQTKKKVYKQPAKSKKVKVPKKSRKTKKTKSKAISRTTVKTGSKGLKINQIRRIFTSPTKILFLVPKPDVTTILKQFKNAWDLKGGAWGSSNNEVQLRILFDFYQNGKLVTKDKWMKFRSGISISDSIQFLYDSAYKDYKKWFKKTLKKGSIEVHTKRIDIHIVRDI